MNKQQLAQGCVPGLTRSSRPGDAESTDGLGIREAVERHRGA